jgi:hypothetical protein
MYKVHDIQSFSGTGAQTSETIYTPTSGKAAAITDIIVTVSEASAITVATSEGTTLIDLPANAVIGGIAHSFNFPVQLGEDETVTLTTSAGNVKATVYAYEQ